LIFGCKFTNFLFTEKNVFECAFSPVSIVYSQIKRTANTQASIQKPLCVPQEFRQMYLNALQGSSPITEHKRDEEVFPGFFACNLARQG